MSFRSRAFSLIEFTVVLALIGLLAGIATVGVRPMLVRGKQEAARTEIAQIRQAVEQFYSVYGRYPTTEEGLLVLRKPTEKISDPLLTQDPIDPWGRLYIYGEPGRTEPYEVICLGADGHEGGTGADMDIVSWNLKENRGKSK
ncbi:MAG: ral secretion pathway protein [Phycisphaerales bacterium]|nr:ral secretion pathway protein [Phycisphaerales bacterium]